MIHVEWFNPAQQSAALSWEKCFPWAGGQWDTQYKGRWHWQRLGVTKGCGVPLAEGKRRRDNCVLGICRFRTYLVSTWTVCFGSVSYTFSRSCCSALCAKEVPFHMERNQRWTRTIWIILEGKQLLISLKSDCVGKPFQTFSFTTFKARSAHQTLKLLEDKVN